MSADEIEQIAAGWLAREDRGLSAEDTSNLEAWLDQSSFHKVAYLRLKSSWQRADRLAALKSPAMMKPDETRSYRRTGRRIGLAVAAALTLLAGGIAWQNWSPATSPGQEFATVVGRMESVRLADGTQIELNTNTKLHADVTDSSRTVMLESGEAYFDVVHDDKRPFTVYAGNRRITDIGTKFSVFHNGDDVRVTVREGKVRVDIINQAAPVLAEAGHVVVTNGGETLIIRKNGSDIADDLSWRDGVLVFHQQTLAEAADQFNRYNERQILVEGPARKIRIGGRFKADNVDVFVLLLHRGFGLSVNEQGGTIIVSR